ncbi:MAG: hypothetical protein NVS4B12_02680 [Ktedonobacteraceae bacterium]
MYIYYVLRGTQRDQPVELDGEVSEIDFPNVDLGNGPDVITHVVKKLHAEGEVGTWEECDLTDDFFNREDNYINFNGRWMRRSDAPWRKDRNN